MALLTDEISGDPADNDFWQTKCRALLLRPAIEPIACSYWARFVDLSFDEARAVSMASALAGRKLAYRRAAARGLSVRGDVGFEPLDVASQWLAKIREAATDPDLLPALPAYAFAQTIMAHPFSDGNGRAARVMVHAALARCAELDLPVVALAPAFYRRADSLASALHKLSDHHDWPAFYSVFLAVLEDAAALTRLFAKRS